LSSTQQAIGTVVLKKKEKKNDSLFDAQELVVTDCAESYANFSNLPDSIIPGRRAKFPSLLLDIPLYHEYDDADINVEDSVLSLSFAANNNQTQLAAATVAAGGRFIIVGEPGSGKSTLCRQLALCWRSGLLKKFQWLFCISLSGSHSPKNWDLASIIHEQCLQPAAQRLQSVDTIRSILYSAPHSAEIMLVVDGVDAILTRAQNDSNSAHGRFLRDLCLFPNLVMTARRSSVDDLQEFLTGDRPKLFRLARLSTEQIKKYVFHFFSKVESGAAASPLSSGAAVSPLSSGAVASGVAASPLSSGAAVSPLSSGAVASGVAASPLSSVAAESPLS